MIREVDLKIWVALLVASIAGAMGMALADGTKPAKAGAFPGKNGHIAFDSDRDADHNPDIYSMNPDGNQQTNLTKNSAYDRNPCYSPNGKVIAFQSLRNGNSEIYRMTSSGGQQTNLTKNPAYDDRPSGQPLR